MNDTFSFARLTLLIKKHWQENRKMHLLGILAATGVLITFMLFALTANKYRGPLQQDDQFFYFFISLGIVFTFYSFFYFNTLNKKEKATYFLLLPASHLEKLVCAIFYCTILTSMVWLGIFSLVNNGMVMLLNKLAAHNREGYPTMFIMQEFVPRKVVNIFTHNQMFRAAFCNCLSLQAAALLGSFFFEKYTFIKTVVTSMLVWLALYMVQWVILNGAMPTKFYLFEIGIYKTPNYMIDSAGRETYQPVRYIFLSPTITSFTRCCLFYAPWPLLTIVTFFRLKEKAI